MKLKWYGHACFGMEFSGGLSVVADPFDESVGYPLCCAKADIVTTSHGHFDHNYTASLEGDPAKINKTGHFDFGGLAIKGTASYHDPENGAKRGNNVIYTYEAEGLRIAHLGDLGHEPNEEQYAALENIDVLLIPIGGFYTIDTETALKVIGKVAPKITIPMHFKTEAIGFPISDEKEFAEKTAAKYWDGTTLEITKDNIESYPGAIVLRYAD